ncbi:MAG TPA: hypothetical protein PKE31_06815 [Pseudomonadota bacterium]|nr:hypothetical protein [Pseudomonadota bacterium]
MPTHTLATILTAAGRRKTVISDCVVLIDEEVQKKGGLSGLAIKGAFAIVKAVKPGFLVEAVDHLLDDFADRLDPFYQSQPAGRLLPSHFSEHSSAIAEALLGITDERAKRAQNQTVKKAYEKLRPTAKKHVEEAVPGIARLIEKHGAQAAA